jgi:hypothetical protein
MHSCWYGSMVCRDRRHRGGWQNNTLLNHRHRGSAQPLAATKTGPPYTRRAKVIGARCLCGDTGLATRPSASVGSTAKEEFQRRCMQMHAKHADVDRTTAQPVAPCRQRVSVDRMRDPPSVSRTEASACFACFARIVFLHLRWILFYAAAPQCRDADPAKRDPNIIGHDAGSGRRRFVTKVYEFSPFQARCQKSSHAAMISEVVVQSKAQVSLSDSVTTLCLCYENRGAPTSAQPSWPGMSRPALPIFNHRLGVRCILRIPPGRRSRRTGNVLSSGQPLLFLHIRATIHAWRDAVGTPK